MTHKIITRLRTNLILWANCKKLLNMCLVLINQKLMWALAVKLSHVMNKNKSRNLLTINFKLISKNHLTRQLTMTTMKNLIW